MKHSILIFGSVLPGIFTAVSATLLLGWLFHRPAEDLTEQVPGLDRQNVREYIPPDIQIGEIFESTGITTSGLQGSWSRFRGDRFDNISTETIRLASRWPGNGPQILWKISLGEGYAGAAIHDGQVFVMDYDETGRADMLRSFHLETGEELWKRGYRVRIKRNHGLSRTIPAVTSRYTVTIGPKMHVMCSDTRTGDFLWGMDLLRDYEAPEPLWYTGQCPVIDGETAIFAPGGKALLIGVDCRTGIVLWETPNPGGLKSSHSSIMPMTVNGKKMWVYAAVGGIAGISAHPEDAGRLLWLYREWAPSVVAPSPVILPDNRIFMTAGYGAGSAMIKVVEDNGVYRAESVFIHGPDEGISSEQQTPIFYRGHLFSIMPEDGGSYRREFVCADLSGRILWSSGKNRRFGLGPYLLADGRFYILNDDGTLVMIEATPDGYRELDSSKVLDGVDAWGPMALTNGLLIVRDTRTMICIDIK